MFRISSLRSGQFKFPSCILLLFSGFILSTSCQTKSNKKEKQDKNTVVKVLTINEQLEEIMSIWPGTYNNDKQIDQVTKEGHDVWRIDDSGENGFLQLQSHYIKLNRPDIGNNVLYVEEYRDHEPAETYRQRIYTLAVDSTDNIKVKMWPFKNKKKYVGAWNNISMLEDLVKDSISAFPDICDLHVTKNGDEYHMVMNGKECAFGDKVFNYQVKLTKDIFSYRDKITQKSNDSIISTAANFAYHDLDRIK